MRAKCYKAVAGVLLGFTAQAATGIASAAPAAPTGANLLEACLEAQRHGFQGSKGMLCNWYVTPCDCQAGKNETIPRVCLPPDASPEQLTGLVVNGLQAAEELRALAAERAAAEILAPVYPCED